MKGAFWLAVMGLVQLGVTVGQTTDATGVGQTTAGVAEQTREPTLGCGSDCPATRCLTLLDKCADFLTTQDTTGTPLANVCRFHPGTECPPDIVAGGHIILSHRVSKSSVEWCFEGLEAEFCRVDQFLSHAPVHGEVSTAHRKSHISMFAETAHGLACDPESVQCRDVNKCFLTPHEERVPDSHVMDAPTVDINSGFKVYCGITPVFYGCGHVARTPCGDIRDRNVTADRIRSIQTTICTDVVPKHRELFACNHVHQCVNEVSLFSQKAVVRSNANLTLTMQDDFDAADFVASYYTRITPAAFWCRSNVEAFWCVFRLAEACGDPDISALRQQYIVIRQMCLAHTKVPEPPDDTSSSSRSTSSIPKVLLVAITTAILTTWIFY